MSRVKEQIERVYALGFGDGFVVAIEHGIP